MSAEHGVVRVTFIIGSVEQDLKKRHRYFIYDEGGEAPVFSVHEDILVRYRLFKGQTVTPELAAEIMAADVRQQAYALAVGYLGTKPRTGKEIERYLGRKEFDPDIVESVVGRLREERLLDDGEYARQFMDQRVRGHFKGSRLIRQELMQRGIGRDDAAEALASLEPALEAESALAAARKKWPHLKGEPREKRQRLMQFLGRRGYPGSVIRDVVREVASGADTDEDWVWLDN